LAFTDAGPKKPGRGAEGTRIEVWLAVSRIAINLEIAGRKVGHIGAAAVDALTIAAEERVL